ncbi:hypothetical protein D3C73_753910 [compost metagenome]
MVDLVDEERAGVQRRAQVCRVFCNLRLGLMPRGGQIRFTTLDRREVELGSKEVDDPICFIAHRANEYGIPERGAIPAIIEDVHGHVLTGSDPFAHERDGTPISLRPLQKTTIAADDLIVTIAS